MTLFNPLTIQYFDISDVSASKYLKSLQSNIISEFVWAYIAYDKTNNIYWRVDVADKYQRGLAIRVNSGSKDISEENLEKIRMSILEQEKGVGLEECQWQDCKNKALKTLAFCTFHAYKNMGMR